MVMRLDGNPRAQMARQQAMPQVRLLERAEGWTSDGRHPAEFSMDPMACYSKALHRGASRFSIWSRRARVRRLMHTTCRVPCMQQESRARAIHMCCLQACSPGSDIACFPSCAFPLKVDLSKKEGLGNVEEAVISKYAAAESEDEDEEEGDE